MERQERRFLEATKRRLEHDLRRIDQLLRQASAPRLTRPGDAARRIQKIVAGIKKRGGRVTKRELGEIVASAGMITTAVGSLYQAGYVKRDLKNKGYVVLGPRASAETQGRKRPRR